MLKTSASFLAKNKDLLFLPIVSLLSCLALIAIVIISGIFALPHMEQFNEIPTPVLVSGTAVLYLLLSFITIFFNTTLIACATERLQGKPCTIGQGFKLTSKHWRVLIAWVILGAVVGAIIRALERAHGSIAEIIAMFFGVAWSVAAYFVLPVMVFEDVGPIQAIKRGVKIFGRGWKKIVAVNLIIIYL